jgi:hypothetical protein
MKVPPKVSFCLAQYSAVKFNLLVDALDAVVPSSVVSIEAAYMIYSIL